MTHPCEHSVNCSVTCEHCVNWYPVSETHGNRTTLHWYCEYCGTEMVPVFREKEEEKA